MGYCGTMVSFRERCRVRVLLGRCLRFSRRENMIASSAPSPAPNTAPDIVNPSGRYEPLPAMKKPIQPITNVQRSMQSVTGGTPFTEHYATERLLGAPLSTLAMSYETER
jgi:hypothetical protein